MRILLLILFFEATHATPTYWQIVHNQPGIDRQYAEEIAEITDRLADKYKVPANVVTAMMRAESNYILNATNSNSNDFGILQINQYHIENGHKFDRYRLLTDLEYSIEAGFIVFQWFYKTYPTLSEAVRRYNCGTEISCIKWNRVVKYWHKVQKFMYPLRRVKWIGNSNKRKKNMSLNKTHSGTVTKP